MPGLFPLNQTSPAGLLESIRRYAELLTGQRYNDVLEQRLSVRDRLLGQADQFGRGEAARINQDYTDTVNASLAGLSDSGLASSNLALNAAMGAQDRRQLAIGDLNDRLLGRRVELERGLEEGIAQFQERRTDAGPSMADAARLGAQGGSMFAGDPRAQHIWLQNQDALLGREQQLLAGGGATTGVPTGLLGDRVRSRVPLESPFGAMGGGNALPGTRQAVFQQSMTEQQRRDAMRAMLGAVNTDAANLATNPNTKLLNMSRDWVQSGFGLGDPKAQALAETGFRGALEADPNAAPGFAASVPVSAMLNLHMRKGDPAIGGGFGIEMSRTPNQRDLMNARKLLRFQNELLGSGSTLRQSF